MKAGCHHIPDEEEISREHLSLGPAQAAGGPAQPSGTDGFQSLAEGPWEQMSPIAHWPFIETFVLS